MDDCPEYGEEKFKPGTLVINLSQTSQNGDNTPENDTESRYISSMARAAPINKNPLMSKWLFSLLGKTNDNMTKVAPNSMMQNRIAMARKF